MMYTYRRGCEFWGVMIEFIESLSRDWWALLYGARSFKRKKLFFALEIVNYAKVSLNSLFLELGKSRETRLED